MKLTVEACGYGFAWEDGVPFFYLADTAWDLVRGLSRDDTEHYLHVRASQGFTVIQLTALFYPKVLYQATANGRYPFIRDRHGRYIPGLIPDQEGDDSYWAQLDRVLAGIWARGMVCALLPAWGDLIDDRDGSDRLFNEQSAYTYGRFLGGRYASAEKLIWILGGDRPLDDDQSRLILRSMVRGIKEAGADQLMSFHPPGPPLLPYSSVDYMSDEEWLDFHMIQSGHEVICFDNWNAINRSLALASGKPVIDGEARYEDHPACFQPKMGYYWDEADVRRTAWWSAMAGASGHTYGNHCIWSFNREPSTVFPYTWQDALQHDGALCMRYLPLLLLSRPFFERRPAQELVPQEECMLGHVGALRGEAYAFIYIPDGGPTVVNMKAFGAGTVKATWFSPRDGSERLIGIVPGAGVSRFVPPTSGKGQDWVLVLDNMDAYLISGG